MRPGIAPQSEGFDGPAEELIMADIPSSALPPYTEHRVQRDGGSLCVRDLAGNGPAFVLLHGFPDNSHIYDELIPHLAAAGRRPIALDFLGFGASDKPTGAHYSFEQQLRPRSSRGCPESRPDHSGGA